MDGYYRSYKVFHGRNSIKWDSAGGLLPSSDECWGMASALAGILLILPFGGRVEYGFKSVWQGYEWGMRDSSLDSYKKNARWIFEG